MTVSTLLAVFYVITSTSVMTAVWYSLYQTLKTRFNLDGEYTTRIIAGFHGALCVLLAFACMSRGLNPLQRPGAEAIGGLCSMEITNPVLQARWFLRYYDKKNTYLFIFVEYSFFAMFLSVRLIYGSLLLHAVIMSEKTNVIVKMVTTSLFLISLAFVQNICAIVWRRIQRRQQSRLAGNGDPGVSEQSRDRAEAKQFRHCGHRQYNASNYRAKDREDKQKFILKQKLQRQLKKENPSAYPLFNPDDLRSGAESSYQEKPRKPCRWVRSPILSCGDRPHSAMQNTARGTATGMRTRARPQVITDRQKRRPGGCSPRTRARMSIVFPSFPSRIVSTSGGKQPMDADRTRRHVLTRGDPLLEGGRARPGQFRLSGEKQHPKRCFFTVEKFRAHYEIKYLHSQDTLFYKIVNTSVKSRDEASNVNTKLLRKSDPNASKHLRGPKIRK
ncbi:unnamed protein product, partial [Nesidiocoris tenuis]